MKKGMVLVTGAGERLGCAIVQSLLEHGYRVIAHYRKSRSSLGKFLEDNKQYTSNVTWWQADFPKDLEKAELLPWADIEAFIPCAALFEQGNLFDGSDWFSQFEMNALVPLELSRLYRKMADRGVIITVIDGNISRANSRFQNYRLSKLFLQEFTRQMAVTIGPGFRVNGIAPGTVIPPCGQEDQSYEKARKLAPSGREVAVKSILSTVHFLLGNQDITGEVIAVDGGVHAL